MFEQFKIFTIHLSFFISDTQIKIYMRQTNNLFETNSTQHSFIYKPVTLRQLSPIEKINNKIRTIFYNIKNINTMLQNDHTNTFTKQHMNRMPITQPRIYSKP